MNTTGRRSEVEEQDGPRSEKVDTVEERMKRKVEGFNKKATTVQVNGREIQVSYRTLRKKGTR